MPRPRYCRNISGKPPFQRFKPAGIPARDLPEVMLTLDEFEALRLADYQGLYQEQAAESMHVSRQTFGRILESAHRKIAQVLMEGACLNIAGGAVAIGATRVFACLSCRRTWEAPFGTGRPEACPHCGNSDFRRQHGNVEKMEE